MAPTMVSNARWRIIGILLSEADGLCQRTVAGVGCEKSAPWP